MLADRWRKLGLRMECKPSPCAELRLFPTRTISVVRSQVRNGSLTYIKGLGWIWFYSETQTTLALHQPCFATAANFAAGPSRCSWCGCSVS